MATKDIIMKNQPITRKCFRKQGSAGNRLCGDNFVKLLELYIGSRKRRTQTLCVNKSLAKMWKMPRRAYSMQKTVSSITGR
uniref:Ribosomal protein S18 n=1 Tax=Panagrellus redivivus TaxID=6233 RepID=A0A7E4VNN9_PANRE